MADPNISTAAGGARSWKWAGKQAWGYPFNWLRDVIQHTFGYTHISKKVANASTTAVLAATPTVVAGTTITTGITNPDVPRVLRVTTAGTTADIAAGNVVITGTNVEGKTITDTLALADNQSGDTNGVLVFKTVTSVRFPAADGTGATISVGTLNKLGLVHRCPPTFTTAVCVQDTGEGDATTKPTVQAAPSASNFDNQLVEKNWVQPATTPDGTTFLYFFYWFHKVKVSPVNDAPDFYSTTTSTSTSSTSTSTSTSSTSTSLSTSSTSSSTSSTSTSSTSTSTTTLPV